MCARLVEVRGSSLATADFSYSGDILVELKKAVVDVNVKKEKTVEELQDELARAHLMAAGAQGCAAHMAVPTSEASSIVTLWASPSQIWR